MDWESIEFEEVDAGWLASIRLPPLSCDTELLIPAGTPVEMRMRKLALLEFYAAWQQLEPQLRRALFAYYAATRDAVDDSGPAIHTEDSVWAHTALYSAGVPELLPEGRVVQIIGRCSWEDEHGLEICVRDGCAIAYVGPHVGNSHRNPRRERPGNFAPSS